MLKTLTLIAAFVVILALTYLLLPSPVFPQALPDAVLSEEPGDQRDPENFRAYFTDLPRAEVIKHYQEQFKMPGVFGKLPSYRLNYPPEEAFTYVADQTLSNYLEEIVYPLRESIFVNGYEPKDDDDKISVNGRPYFSKVTVRYYRSNPVVRVVIMALSVGAMWWLGKEYWGQWKALWKKKNN
jgi:hypothetical protein